LFLTGLLVKGLDELEYRAPSPAASALAEEVSA